MNELLDSKFVDNLRDVINKTNIFVEDINEKEKFDLICAVMDRFDNSVTYINSHQNIPTSESEIIMLFHHFCIIREGIKVVSNILNIDSEPTDIFQNYCQEAPFLILRDDYKGDDKFFDYLRSLFFAHPFITERSIPNPIKGEVQYSPYILNNRLEIFSDIKDSVGVMVYSNKRDAFCISIRFDDLKEYIRLKFEKTNDITNAFQEIINNKEKEWSSRKVNRNQNIDAILLEVIDILNERYLDDSDIKELYDFLTCSISDESNIKIVNEFRNIIIKAIPIICDCIDNMNYEELYQITNPLLSPNIREVYPMMHYQLE